MRIALKQAAEAQNYERVLAIAYQLADALAAAWAIPAATPANYTVLSPHYRDCSWFPIATGTKEYCIGYAEATGHGVIVACGAFVCWPEERYGDMLEGQGHE